MTNNGTKSPATTTYVGPEAMNAASASTLAKLMTLGLQHGWAFDITKEQASCEWLWTKGDKSVGLGGWHGKTRSFGIGMVFATVDKRDENGLTPELLESFPGSENGQCRRFDARDVAHYIDTVLPRIVAAVSALLVG